ncbi:hypothetical protein RJ639_002958 [Escallonia herrerae]|uniref:Uncharacterized protein n=1 Tax=Escallonia herrerae TaxID=1293975 RepID=A0AA89B201_9ASTE|nr:hypothetical protein RJ639_002958 [Escallonia herrerae]
MWTLQFLLLCRLDEWNIPLYPPERFCGTKKVVGRVIPNSGNAMMFLAHIKEQFYGSSKAHATTLINKMVKLKYSGSGGVREHILRMNDMTSQLKGLDMEISEDRGNSPGFRSSAIAEKALSRQK